jgi:pimeloyl-ACP methyl ester carboxylesterase
MTEILRTPESRFADVPGFAWPPRYAEGLAGAMPLRMAYIDEGPRDARHIYLCLHGNPTWSYLYRKMIPVFLGDGGRVVAPDLIGFGRSDKPADIAAYHFDLHRDALLALIRRLDLQRITLVCQDWGGILGLTLPMAEPRRFERLLVMNTMLATGDAPLSPGFLAWRDWCAAAAYDAPFPDPRHQAGARAFPAMVCDRPDAPGAAKSRAARDWWRTQWRGRSFMAIGMQDPVLGPAVMAQLRADIAGCPPPLQIAEGGHFVQECGERIAQAALAHWAKA